MKIKEAAKFVVRRAQADEPGAFLARLARFAVIASCLPARERAYKEKQGGDTLIQGSLMRLDKEDTGITKDLLLDGIREPLITRAFTGMLLPSDICLDIGANIGYYALQEAKVCRKVYAVEPVLQNYLLLRQNIDLNHYQNIWPYNLAMGESSGDGEIAISPMRNMCSMYGDNGYREYAGKEKVLVSTIDDFLKGKDMPSVIRMDVEGYELNILKGAKEFLKSGTPCQIFIEVHCDILREKTARLAELLKAHGFHISCATFEPHPATRNLKIVSLLDRIIGAEGYLDIGIDDLIYGKKYLTGQVEDLEVIFER